MLTPRNEDLTEEEMGEKNPVEIWEIEEYFPVMMSREYLSKYSHKPVLFDKTPNYVDLDRIMLNIKIRINPLVTNFSNWGECSRLLIYMVNHINLYFPNLKAKVLKNANDYPESVDMNTEQLFIEINKAKNHFPLLTPPVCQNLLSDFLATKFNPFLRGLPITIPKVNEEEYFASRTKFATVTIDSPAYNLFGEVLAKMVAKYCYTAFEIKQNLPSEIRDVRRIIVNYLEDDIAKAEEAASPLAIARCKIISKNEASLSWSEAGLSKPLPLFAHSIVKYCLSIFPNSVKIKENTVIIHRNILNSVRFTRHFREAVSFFSTVEKMKYQALQLGLNVYTQDTILKLLDKFDFDLCDFLRMHPPANIKTLNESKKLVEYLNSLIEHLVKNPLYNFPIASIEGLTQNLLLSNHRLKQNLSAKVASVYQERCQISFNSCFIVLEQINRVANLLAMDDTRPIDYELIHHHKWLKIAVNKARKILKDFTMTETTSNHAVKTTSIINEELKTADIENRMQSPEMVWEIEEYFPVMMSQKYLSQSSSHPTSLDKTPVFFKLERSNA